MSGADAVPGNVAGDAGHKQRIVVGVLVTDQGRHSQGDRLLVESTAGRGTAFPAAAVAGRGLAGDRLGASADGQRGNEPCDFRRHAGLQFPRPRRRSAHGPVHDGASSRPRRRGTPARPAQALLPSTRMPCRSYRLRLRLHRTTTAESTLAFLDLQGQRGVARAAEEHQVIQVGAGHAQRSRVVHRQQFSRYPCNGRIPSP